MKRDLILILLLAGFLITGCTALEKGEGRSYLTAVESYPSFMSPVMTRTQKNEMEMQITARHLLVFDADGRLVSLMYKTGQNAVFIIDRHQAPFLNYYDKKKLENCKIYILANFKKEELDHVQSLQDLQQHKVYASVLYPQQEKDFRGLPMIGAAGGVNLNPDHPDPVLLDPIPVKSLYAKIKVLIQVRTDQSTPGEIPTFTLKQWKVVNAPTYAALGTPAAGEETDFVKDRSNPAAIVHNGENWVTGKNPVSGSDNMSFEFYVLEHRVNPQNEIDVQGHYTKYPSGIKENEKQRFKPLLCTPLQRPMYILLDGSFSDHQGHPHDVQYQMFLGNNSIDDFHIDRNHFYQNVITIKGLTKSSPDSQGDQQQTASIDYRVHIDESQKDMIITVHRETMLDCHIEIRPLDIELKEEGPDNYIQIELVDPQTKQPVTTRDFKWVRFEKRSTGGNGYCDNGKRKFFTTDLLQSLNQESGIRTRITSNADGRIWLYFDENTQASENGMRTAMLKFSYCVKGEEREVLYFKFMQHDLYPVKIGGQVKYYIEYYEEYLYNFDPHDPLSNRTDGMPWGLTDVTYSENPSIDNLPTGLKGIQFVKDAILKAGGNYDYKDNYQGKSYTDKLIRKGDGLQSFEVLSLDEQPRSAAEYCYNKNKRNPQTGKVDPAEMKWYLPAIGEIQEITRTAYGKFAVFQDEYYWSSQTTYGNGEWSYQGLGYYSGPFLYENTGFARATKTRRNPDGSYHFEESEVTGVKRKVECRWTWSSLSVTSKISETSNVIHMDAGNQPRSNILRVRAVRKP